MVPIGIVEIAASLSRTRTNDRVTLPVQVTRAPFGAHDPRRVVAYWPPAPEQCLQTVIGERGCDLINGRCGGLDGNPHKGSPVHASSAVQPPFPTRDTPEVLFAVRWLVKSLMKRRQLYKRGGVGLAELVRGDQQQSDLFSAPNPLREHGVDVLDRINAEFVRGGVGMGEVGCKVGGSRPGEQRLQLGAAQWRPTLQVLSPAYITRWDEILRAH